ncbi:energy-coupling factor transport system substrate-specific component [Alkalithermobacter thermoalcaliphilus JW-YL-7 = DSM 7308]|uniref:Energy-coupling factor transport system substrate-specific component n=1 Tax=Alkalithermobacter thermoalcaliphilus JW-YL-7 = DSM 7308 TaxID=1121328 RepID=A0A150FSA3_CLOPD|nr:hypothetical protein JWYL7_1564 [[Clostridium] paradoxum JW-YL-7 = DSM 7308]SHL16691.1 energy-coupling factor transport system substrate-specific component [[Clostridium] paradoxum JW-YL-7 = DSM 7308]
MKTKDITFIGISVSLIITLGYVFYTVGSIFLLPGSKYIFMAPFLGFMFCIVALKVRKRGTIFLVSTIFGFIMMLINIFMSFAIILSGILTDLIGLIFFRQYEKKVVYISAIYPLFSLIVSFFVSNYLTGNKLHLMIYNKYSFILAGIITYILGLVGSYLGYKLLSRI